MLLIAACVALGAGATFLISINLPKAHEAQATLIVGQSLSGASLDYSQLLVSQRLAITAQAGDPDAAAAIANGVARHLIATAPEIQGKRGIGNVFNLLRDPAAVACGGQYPGYPTDEAEHDEGLAGGPDARPSSKAPLA